MREALKLALEALQVATTPLAKDRQEVLRAITAIKEALAQPEQDIPVMRKISNSKHHELSKAQPEQEPRTADEKLARMKAELAYMRQTQLEQEPYGYLKLNTGKFVNEVEGLNPMKDKRYLPLYTTLPQRIWVGLTDEDYQILRDGVVKQGKPLHWMIEHIEAKLKEKNT